ncbi:restriction endonuclease [[Clostridium] colinum]|uniref:restriction endonuclease n=1 Tax=[Clostridium] colinum TaxID=36835 RepID=UPI00202509BA|nr:DEAD/DEAH box helicase family protein [[Clostridium] colinum]
MKIKFKEQAFQKQAIQSVINLFNGQIKQDYTTTYDDNDIQTTFIPNDISYNAINISSEKILENMQRVQKQNMLQTTNDIQNNTFCIEMETGTGKTYTYTKTIFELNKKYGFKKFIIVVPSIAIKQGVFKSFQIMEDELKKYNQNYNVFIYNSSKLNQVKNFATSNNIEIMIINIDAFKKDENIINQDNDKLAKTPIEYIKQTSPIVIIDEPQSVDNTEKSKEAINSLNPLAILKYSATHREKINLIYRLTPVDAFQMGIVKQISVASVFSSQDFNTPYLKLLEVSMDNGVTGGINFKAKLEIDILKDGKITRTKKILKQNDDLESITKREEYNGYVITNIDCTENKEHIEFANTQTLSLGKSIGDIDEDLIKKEQIKRTIEQHLEKELIYTDLDIKVLSLFFIDKVDKYRLGDGEKGIYAKMFEECYTELINLPKYKILKERFTQPIEKIHNGYFSKDKKGNFKNTKGESNEDDNTYKTIMQDKEYLLSFECPLRFIFSHSALKEGWDSPNVFQVCTLIEQKSKFSARQKIGRGLRLCVNQNGERIEDKAINNLHIIANESFEDFAKNLQKEIEEETGLKFGSIDITSFIGITYEQTVIEQVNIKNEDATEILNHFEKIGYIDDEGNVDTEKIKNDIEDNFFNIPEKFENVKKEVETIFTQQKIENLNKQLLTNITYEKITKEEKITTEEDAREIFQSFKDSKYIDNKGQVTKTLKEDLEKGNIKLPEKFENAKDNINNIVLKSTIKLPINNANKQVVVKLNKQVLVSPDFLELWEKIKYKTKYRFKLDEESYKNECIEKIKEMPKINRIRIVTKNADINVEKDGVYSEEKYEQFTNIEYKQFNPTLEDLWEIAEKSSVHINLVLEVLSKSGRLDEIYNDPKKFIEQVIDIFKEVQAKTIINGIYYIKNENDKYYIKEEIFDTSEIIAYLDKNALKIENNKTPYDYIVYESETVEKSFAKQLDNDPSVKIFFKFPSKFKIDTPIGSYNPDWAIYRQENDTEKLYFVIETKGSINSYDLRIKENLKIKCGKKHFEALQTNVNFDFSNDWLNYSKNKI